MARHQPLGNQRVGLLYATITMLVWSVLPHVLKILLGYIDPFSLAWYRFLFASTAFFFMLRRRGELPALDALTRQQLVLLGAAILGLAANYIFFLVGLDLTSPATSQVLIQIGPVVLALGGIVIFHERFTRVQWLGFAILLVGLGVFFGSRISELVPPVSLPALSFAGAGAVVAGSLITALGGASASTTEA